MAELQLHGSRAVVQAIFDAAAEQGLRLAEPGEFVRRAFDNGKLDLTEVEGLADLVAAETEMQRRQAIAQASGGLARLAEAWRGTLIELRAEIEARLDFSDEGDVAEALPAAFQSRSGGAAGGNGGGVARCGCRRARARRISGGDPGPAQRRKVVPAQCVSATRRGDRHGRAGHHARRPGSAARYRRLSGSSLRHGGLAGGRFRRRAGGRPARQADRGIRRSRSCGSRTAPSPRAAPPSLPDRPIWRVPTKIDLSGCDASVGYFRR